MYLQLLRNFSNGCLIQIFQNSSGTEHSKLYSFLLIDAIVLLSLIAVCFMAVSPSVAAQQVFIDGLC